LLGKGTTLLGGKEFDALGKGLDGSNGNLLGKGATVLGGKGFALGKGLDGGTPEL
jgi:hypothetical protein